MSFGQFVLWKKWQVLSALRWTNRRIDRRLQPCGWSEVEGLGLQTASLELDKADYDRLVALPAMRWYGRYDYVHSKPLEYLTTPTLGALQQGQVLLDAAGGSDAEFVRAAREYHSFQFVGYSQDAHLDGVERDGVHFVGGSIDSVPLPDASIDLITCHHSLEHFRGDADTLFVREACRLMSPGARTVIAPIFIANEYAEIWNRRPDEHFDVRATQIVDRTAGFAGWGPFEGFARTYDIAAFRQRLLESLPSSVTASIYRVVVDGEPVPDTRTNRHVPALNGEMKALVLERARTGPIPAEV